MPGRASLASRLRACGLIVLPAVAVLVPLAWFLAIPAIVDFHMTLSSQLTFSSQIPFPFLRRYDGKIVGRTSLPATVELVVNDAVIAQTATDGRGHFGFGDVVYPAGPKAVEVRASTRYLGRRVQVKEVLAADFDPPAPPLAVPFRASTSDPVIVVHGRANRLNDVIVWQGAVSARVRADPKDGRFRTEFTVAEPGVYEINAQAVNVVGQVSLPSPAYVVTYDPDTKQDADTPSVPSRALSAAVSHKMMTLEVTANLHRTDPLLGMLWRQASEAVPQFVDWLFAGLHINQFPLSLWFQNVVPDVYIDGDVATVTLRSNPELRRFPVLPLTDGGVEFWRPSPQGAPEFPLADSTDVIEVRVSDYAVVSYDPLPHRLENGVALWKGDDAKGRGDGTILMHLRTSLANPLRIARIDPLDLVPFPAVPLIALAFAVLLSIPIVWAGLLHLDDDHLPVGRLVTFVFVAPIIDTIFVVGFGLMHVWVGLRHPKLPPAVLAWFARLSVDPPLVILLVASLIVVAAAAILRALLARPLAARVLTGAILQAALIGCLSAASGIALTLSGAKLTWHELVATALVLAVPLLATHWTLARLANAWSLKRPMWAAASAAAVTLVGILLAYPFGAESGAVYFQRTHVVAMIVRTFFATAAPVVPLVVAVFVARSLARREADPAGAQLVALGVFIAASYVVGATTNWMLVPIPLLLALVVFKRFVFLPVDAIEAVAAVAPEVRAARARLIAHVVTLSTARHYKDAIERLTKKFAAGDLAPADFTSRVKAVTAQLRGLEADVMVADGVRLPDLALGVGAEARRWDGAVHALRHASPLVVALTVASIALVVLRTQSSTVYPALSTIVLGITSLGYWLVGAMFFGYFFTDLRGATGLTKGMRVAAATTICLLPVSLASASSAIDVVGVVVRVVQFFVFFGVLGSWAFDYRVARGALGERFDLRVFAHLEGVPSLAVLGSVAVAGIGAATTSVVQGQVKSLAVIVGKTLLPEFPGIPDLR